MTTPPYTARQAWRRVRLCARYLDQTMPFWWKNQATLVPLLRGPNSVVNRCWRQAIRQRIGI